MSADNAWAILFRFALGLLAASTLAVARGVVLAVTQQPTTVIVVVLGVATTYVVGVLVERLLGLDR